MRRSLKHPSVVGLCVVATAVVLSACGEDHPVAVTHPLTASGQPTSVTSPRAGLPSSAAPSVGQTFALSDSQGLPPPELTGVCDEVRILQSILDHLPTGWTPQPGLDKQSWGPVVDQAVRVQRSAHARHEFVQDADALAAYMARGPYPQQALVSGAPVQAMYARCNLPPSP